jgi:DNA uptake protein ComE-like DNA-binding protein
LVWLSAIPLGLGAWAPTYAGVKAENRRWIALGIVWSLITLAGWIGAIATHGKSGIWGVAIILGWIGAVATTVVIRPAYERQLGSSFAAAEEGAKRRLTDRERARQLARENPALAREMGVGRPDLPGAQDAGLVDVNGAPAAVIAKLPGVGDALAGKIVAAREQAGGFTSVVDLGNALDLDGDVVERLREDAVFLPR